MSNKCPICQKDDQLMKASAIVQGGTHHISGQVPISRTYQDSNGLHERVSYESYNATQQSSLAAKLIPPQKPSLPHKPPSLLIVRIVWGAFAVFAIAGAINFIRAESDLSILATLVLCAPIMFFSYRSVEKRNREYPNKLALVNLEIQKWEHAISRWNQLYYCYRDDCVFVAGDTRSSDSSRTREYLYQS